MRQNVNKNIEDLKLKRECMINENKMVTLIFACVFINGDHVTKLFLKITDL